MKPGTLDGREENSFFPFRTRTDILPTVSWPSTTEPWLRRPPIEVSCNPVDDVRRFLPVEGE
jgi:hypothetical protein